MKPASIDMTVRPAFAPSFAALAASAAIFPADMTDAPPPSDTVLLHARDITLATPDDAWRTLPCANPASISAELTAARDASERMQIIHGMLRIIGFSSLSYLMFELRGTRVARTFVVQGPVPAHMDDAYFTQAHHLADPRLKAVCSGNAPLIWERDELAARLRAHLPHGQVCALLQTLRDSAPCSGFMLGMPVPQSPLMAVASFASAQRGRDWIDEGVLGQATILALALHQSLGPGVRALACPAEDDSLSHMQQRILGCLASGLSDKGIALRLHTTTHNVDYHLRLLRKRYGAANRTELAYAAGRLGLV